MSIKPKLNLFDTTMAAVSLVIGIGIFRTPAIVAKDTGSPELFFAAWITGGIISIVGGLVFAEIGARKPFAGGFYKLVSDGYSPALAFMVNWLGLIITVSATFAAVAMIASEYLIKAAGDIQPFIDQDFLKSDEGVKITAAIITLILVGINYLGIKSGAMTLNFITVLKISTIVVFGIASLIVTAKPNNEIITTVPEMNSAFVSAGFMGFASGLIAVFFTVGGYQLTTNLAADVKNSKRNLPLGIISGVAIVTILYLIINFGYYKLLGFEGIKNSNLIAADMANALFGSAGSRIISIVIFISAAGFLNVTIMYIPRTYLAMSEDKVLPKIFMKVNPKNQVQEFALIFMSVLIFVFMLTQGRFDKILNIIMFNDTLVIAITASTIFIFRYRDKKFNIKWNGFKVPLYPVLPALFVIILLLVSYMSFREDIISAIISFCVLLLSYPIYKIMTKFIK